MQTFVIQPAPSKTCSWLYFPSLTRRKLEEEEEPPPKYSHQHNTINTTHFIIYPQSYTLHSSLCIFQLLTLQYKFGVWHCGNSSCSIYKSLYGAFPIINRHIQLHLYIKWPLQKQIYLERTKQICKIAIQIIFCCIINYNH